MDYQLRQEACKHIFLVGIHTNLNIITRQQAAITSVSSSLSSSSTSLSSTAPATTTSLSPSSFAGSGLVAPATSLSSSYTTAAASELSQQQQHRQDLLVELEKNKKKIDYLLSTNLSKLTSEQIESIVNSQKETYTTIEKIINPQARPSRQ